MAHSLCVTCTRARSASRPPGQLLVQDILLQGLTYTDHGYPRLLQAVASQWMRGSMVARAHIHRLWCTWGMDASPLNAFVSSPAATRRNCARPHRWRGGWQGTGIAWQAQWCNIRRVGIYLPVHVHRTPMWSPTPNGWVVVFRMSWLGVSLSACWSRGWVCCFPHVLALPATLLPSIHVQDWTPGLCGGPLATVLLSTRH